MKNVVVVIGLVFAAASFQASAASIRWYGEHSFQQNVLDGKRNKGTTTTGGLWANAVYQLGEEDSFLGRSQVSDVWYFDVDTASKYAVTVTSTNGDGCWLSEIWFGGYDYDNNSVIFNNPFVQNGNVWSATINVIDNAFYYIHPLGYNGIGVADLGLDHGYSISIEKVAETPIPAAVWLFGSAIAGLMGVKRRKA